MWALALNSTPNTHIYTYGICKIVLNSQVNDACCYTSRLYRTLKVDMPGADDLKRDSKMDVALGWCCCLEAIEGEREPVP